MLGLLLKRQGHASQEPLGAVAGSVPPGQGATGQLDEAGSAGLARQGSYTEVQLGTPMPTNQVPTTSSLPAGVAYSCMAPLLYNDAVCLVEFCGGWTVSGVIKHSSSTHHRDVAHAPAQAAYAAELDYAASPHHAAVCCVYRHMSHL